ncbi:MULTISPECIES: ATP-binding protein [Streptomyces]|uniref:ATP-binding protein n=1 Tax=Streptomyces abikoensis TaxID=97398 RepID=A0ABW7T177_9ACTN
MSNSALCPPETSAVPTPANFNYSLGLPGGPYCISTARNLVRTVLREHDLGDLAEVGVLATSELLANAYAFTPGREAHLSMRWRFGVLRLTVFDEHPSHEAAEIITACLGLRRDALSLLDAVTGACGGICGLAEADAPLYGSRVWVVLPREAGALYARL